MSFTSDTYTAVAPALVSEFERKFYWNGISADPPHLIYRSDLDSNPFPHPTPGDRWPYLPVKTAYGVFNTPLNPVWSSVAPLINASLKKRGIARSVLKTARFVTEHENGEKTLGPIVIWIALHPGKNTPSDARDASPEMLRILAEHGVEDAVVEWYEGKVERLVGPPLLRVTDSTNPSYYVRRPLTAALGMPIATMEMEREDAQGSLSFFFHESRDSKGELSARVFGVSCKHVLHKDMTVDYEFEGSGASRQYVHVCGDRRYNRFATETRDLIRENVDEAVSLAEEITRLEQKETRSDPEEAEEDKAALEKKKRLLEEVNSNNRKLQAFFTETDAGWHTIGLRIIGSTHWAPKIAVDVDELRYTRDIGTFELDPEKFRPNFKGNVVDLGNKFSSSELKKIFWPNGTNPTGMKFPSNRQLRIRGAVPREFLARPDCFDENGYPVYIVGKDGNTTDFTVGRYAGLEAYLCDESGQESIEAAVYNYSKTSGNFSAKGDSGSLIFTGNGQMLAILHSGMPRGFSSHVTFGTPAFWVIQQLKTKYKYADFAREAF
ncbi:hypothetical protein GSI_11792 [Ganoderma sinense ZZ0214-1]|uniref:Uncharacterized protein n=1 Tax=Ganoderma sinense ZZ0214-1 TaxID=1077348 RepID=A0A2G8RXI8_9APHY|nr:hypothetical protein GSI_11792 [Ganoderma sinense ZZ0214-1]